MNKIVFLLAALAAGAASAQVSIGRDVLGSGTPGTTGLEPATAVLENDIFHAPQYMPQYQLATAHRGAALDREADTLYRDGTDAKSNDDKYVLSTVFFAAVLFFAGISLRLDWRPLRVAVLAAAGAMLVGGAVFVLGLPVA